MDEMDELDEGASLGVGASEDFTWKGLLDFTTCTECGRCQSQCPAWNTEKPLSPKLLIMGAARPRQRQGAVHAGAGQGRRRPGARCPRASRQCRRTTAHARRRALSWDDVPLVGDTGYDGDSLAAYTPTGPDAIIDTDVLWSCTTCGACVEQCPVDIEHVDHIIDMRRYQTLIESAFPSELGGLFKNLEGKGNPWGMGARARLDWAKDLPFPVKVLGQDVEKASDVEWLFWVGCAGAYEDRAKQTTRAVAELLDTAGVSFAVLGDGETCTGDSARRAGQRAALPDPRPAERRRPSASSASPRWSSPARTASTRSRTSTPPLGGSYEVVHHTQLLNRLVRDKKLVPVARPSDVPSMSSAKNPASTASTVTYHDPCYLGRHNGVYAPPRELIGALPGVELREMERTRETSFCCGAGGARMWMEEKLGTQINTNRTEEAIATGAERIAIGCPFCRVMISDGLTAKQAEGEAESVEVVDVAQMLLAAVRRGQEPEDSAGAAVGGEGTAGMPSAPGPEVTAPAAAATAATAAPAGRRGADGPRPTPGTDPATGRISIGTAPPHRPQPDRRSKIDQLVEVAPPSADPWDQPATVDDTTAGAPAGEPSEERGQGRCCRLQRADADPWDEPAPPQPGERRPSARATNWSTPVHRPPAARPGRPGIRRRARPVGRARTAASARSATAPRTSSIAGEPDQLGATTAPASVDDVDPWDEPAPPPAPASAEPYPERPIGRCRYTGPDQFVSRPRRHRHPSTTATRWDEPAPATARPHRTSRGRGETAGDETLAEPEVPAGRRARDRHPSRRGDRGRRGGTGIRGDGYRSHGRGDPEEARQPGERLHRELLAARRARPLGLSPNRAPQPWLPPGR